MAKFSIAYKVVDRNEGGYVNDPLDPGGETYRGIARNYHPNWEGWTLIDFYKSNFGNIPTGAFLSQIYPPHIVLDTHMVPAFFEMLWNRSRAGEIKDQNVANIYFDFFVLHSRAVQAMQEALNFLGAAVTIDNVIGPQTLGAINRQDPNKLHDVFKGIRKVYHDQRSDSKFYKGWITRNNKFPKLSNIKMPSSGSQKADSGKMAIVILLIAGGLGAWAHSEHLGNRLKAGDYEK